MQQEGSLSGGLEALARAVKGRRSIVIPHKNADPDAIASSILVARLVSCLGGEACIALPEGLSGSSKRLVKELGIELPQCAGEEDVAIVVDAANPSQLGHLQDTLSRARILALIDHHTPAKLAGSAHIRIIDTGASSTSEILAFLLKAARCCTSPEEATIGLAGIIHDSKRFLILGPRTFEASQWLVEQGGDYRRALSIMTTGQQATFSERMARLKAASRLRLGRACKEILVAVTHIGSYESSTARSLIDLGADVAVVLTERREGYRAAVRISRLAEERGIRADVIASYLAEKYGGQGGGHPGAAMAHLPFIAPSIEEATDLVARSLPGKVARICTQVARG